ncbi:unnamed protein product [Timema podura]|uniref:Uncharacterized protein n=1 Tax=Timema podura TaxID=61482 RepID=A0ABN7PCH8_TIMPD|nr:unnamed protein product [Timema podura]
MVLLIFFVLSKNYEKAIYTVSLRKIIISILVMFNQCLQSKYSSSCHLPPLVR